MQRFRHFALTALLAGALAGCVLSLLQHFFTTPMIEAAELYEAAAPATHDHSAHDAHWMPEEGAERAVYTGLASMAVGIGYGLLLVVVMVRFMRPDWRHGLALGVAGFAVFQLAPALGLPPTLPGMPEPALAGRQAWWLGTVLCTALALALWLRGWRSGRRLWYPLGAVLLIAPHLVGAPVAQNGVSLLPPALIRQFGMAALLVTAVFWMALGAAAGAIYARLAAKALSGSQSVGINAGR